MKVSSIMAWSNLFGFSSDLKMKIWVLITQSIDWLCWFIITIRRRTKWRSACSDQLSLVAGKIQEKLSTNHQCACVYEFQTARHLVFQKYWPAAGHIVTTFNKIEDILSLDSRVFCNLDQLEHWPVNQAETSCNKIEIVWLFHAWRQARQCLDIYKE